MNVTGSRVPRLNGRRSTMILRLVLVCVVWLPAVMAGCAQQSWESAMEAGEATMRSGQYADAERIFTQAVKKAEQFGLHDRRVAVTLSRLAQAYTAQEKYVEAEPVYLQALKIYQDVHGEDHVDVAATLNNLGVLHRKHGQFVDAQALLARALKIKEKIFGPDDLEVALGLSNLAAVYSAQNQFDPAAQLLQRVVAIREKRLGPKHPDVAKALEEYAALLRKSHRDADAMNIEARAQAIRTKPQP